MLVLGIVTAAATALAVPDGTSRVDHYWRWSDGSRALARTFTEATHPGGPPMLVVVSRPAAPHERVVLQFRDAGRWVTEDAAYADQSGAARLQLNPFCADGDWCHARYDYRLVVGGESAALRVTFGR